ncbi:hypothetical protein [Nonomuraea sp. NPDC049158]|uniref:hypothetical protein n=1 Tax=Nonomuraea sp. NPDC049158 TaxID=3155649 RepID=UPI0033C5878E
MYWPVADLDPVRRLRVLAAGVPGARVAERILPDPFELVWEVASDLEREFGTFEPDMRHLRIVADDGGGRLVAEARSKYGMRARFDVDLRPGWRRGSPSGPDERGGARSGRSARRHDGDERPAPRADAVPRPDLRAHRARQRAGRGPGGVRCRWARSSPGWRGPG